MCMYTESLGFTAETNTILSIKYTPIKIKRKCKAKTINDNAVNVRNITMSMV